MQKFLKDKYHTLTPEPGLKYTKAKIIESMGKRINKLSRAVYNCTDSPSRINLLEKLNLRGDFSNQEERSRTLDLSSKSSPKYKRKFKLQGRQVVNLPRLPYGQHSNYEESEFLKNHIIDMGTGRVLPPEFSSIQKECSLQTKLDRKNKRNIRYSSDYTNNLKKYLIYPSLGGSLHCTKEGEVIKSYDNEKNKYKLQRTFKEIELPKDVDKLTSIRRFKTNADKDFIEDIEKILNAS